MDGGESTLFLQEGDAFIIDFILLFADVFLSSGGGALRVEFQNFKFVSFDLLHVLDEDRHTVDFDVWAGRSAVISLVHGGNVFVLVGAHVRDFHFFAELVEGEFLFRLQGKLFVRRNRECMFHAFFEELIFVFQGVIQIDGGFLRNGGEIGEFLEESGFDGRRHILVRRVLRMVLEEGHRQFVGRGDAFWRQFGHIRILGVEMDERHQTNKY